MEPIYPQLISEAFWGGITKVLGNFLLAELIAVLLRWVCVYIVTFEQKSHNILLTLLYVFNNITSGTDQGS